ncbi:MAG: fluoride efflux transporter CrcB [Pseudochelatococcus sp.]|uniref:fluoride efflux transporter CrcB n=1 Tax=Pseudochelatococcus sp. TaxID=2020869 RepID=UPI003D8E194A
MTRLIAVFVGAGIGGALRWQVGVVAARWFRDAFPWGTLFINVSGSFVMGALAGLFLERPDAERWQIARLFLLTGVLGGYTTFSSFSLEAITLWERGDVLAAALYCIGSVILGLAGLMIGLVMVRSFS